MTLVIDASVALKFVYLEAGTPAALAVLDRDDERVAPTWMTAEVANGLANKMRFEGASLGSTQRALQALPDYIDRLAPTEPMLHDSLRLAAELGHPLYDCLYLQLAIAEDGVVLTADDGFVKAAGRAGFTSYVERLRW